MARPRDLGVIDLMLEVPSGEAGMGMGAARQLTRDKGTDNFTHHPAQYLFKTAPERMSKTTTVDQIVEMMDAFGVQMAQIGVSARNPEPALQMFEKYPTRFFGSVGVDPHAGVQGLRALEEPVKLHRNIKSASASPGVAFNSARAISSRRSTSSSSSYKMSESCRQASQMSTYMSPSHLT